MSTRRTALPLASHICGGEYLTVQAVLAQVPGVVAAVVNPASEMAYVEFDPVLTNPDALVAVLKRSGFTPRERAAVRRDRPSVGGQLRMEIMTPAFPFTRSVPMRFDTKRFAFALAAAWAVWYAICSLFVAVAPAQTQAVFSFAMHYELTGARSLSWASFFGGLILTTAVVAVFAATVGGFFNAGSRSRLSEPLTGRLAELPR